MPATALGCRDNQSYTTYADIGRPYVVWNVVATPEFSVSPQRWCFPVAGCVAYRGYFHEQAARKFAAELRRRGFDVAIDGVPAYSTLGKFSDPVLSSMLRYDDDELAATIFHELAHQLLYVKGDSAFNEAFATTVEDAGLERWLVHEGTPGRIAEYRARPGARARPSSKLLAAPARSWRGCTPRTNSARRCARASSSLRGPGAADRRDGEQPGSAAARSTMNGSGRASTMRASRRWRPTTTACRASSGCWRSRTTTCSASTPPRALAGLPRAQRDAQLCGPAAAAADAAAD